MLFKLFLLSLLGLAAAQNYRVCIPETERNLCNSLELGGSQAVCVRVESKIDCALKLARGEADIGVFNEEETLLLGLQQPNEYRVVANIRNVNRLENSAFDAVAIVSNSHTGGLGGLRGARYCHPGFDYTDLKWSPRVLKEFEQNVVYTSCPPNTPPGKTLEEMEIEQLNNFFSGGACRPGRWSVNATIDANLKREFPNLCSLCGPNNTNSSCNGYTIDMGASVSGADNNNRHIQALECMRSNQNNTVAYVAWQHVREYFNNRNPGAATSYAALCPDGTTTTLTTEVLNTASAPCAFVRQPWGTIVANTANAQAIQTALTAWWPNGASPGAGTWQTTLFNGIVGGAEARVVFDTQRPTLANYTSSIRPIPQIDATASCQPARRWCTLSTAEHTKCLWTRSAAYSLGVQPVISCQQRASIFECLKDIQEDRADFIASSSNYGYLARQHYSLSPVKLVQNSRSSNAFTRVAAFVKETSAQNDITRFENLRGKKACFPEFGGIAFVAFVRAAQERGVLSSSECDYAKAVGSFFDGACAPGALDASHALGTSDFNSSTLCSQCKPVTPVMGNYSNSVCTYEYATNMYYGNNGSLACLADPANDIAILQVQNISAYITQLGLNGSQFRALCRNNTLAATTGVAIDDGCLLAHVVNSEVVTRRNDPLNNALSVLLESLDLYFGYNAETGAQLINLEIFSPFDGVNDLLFKDSAIGFAEPTLTSANDQARNYIELFRHLESCTGAAPGLPGLATNNVYSVAMMLLMACLTRFVILE